MEPLQDCEADQNVYKKEEQKAEQEETCEDRQHETKGSPPKDVIPYPIQRIDSTQDQPKEETKVTNDEAKPLQTDLVGASLIEETLLETNPVIDPPVATVESIESQLGLGPPTKCEISSLEMQYSVDESDVQVKNDPDIIAKEVEVLTDPDDEAFREPQMKANSQIETSLESKAKETKTDLEVEVPAELQAEVAELLRYHSTKSGGEMTSLKDIIDLDDTPVSKIEEGQNHAAKSKKIGVEEEGNNDDDGNREAIGEIIPAKATINQSATNKPRKQPNNNDREAKKNSKNYEGEGSSGRKEMATESVLPTPKFLCAGSAVFLYQKAIE